MEIVPRGAVDLPRPTPGTQRLEQPTRTARVLQPVVFPNGPENEHARQLLGTVSSLVRRVMICHQHADCRRMTSLARVCFLQAPRLTRRRSFIHFALSSGRGMSRSGLRATLYSSSASSVMDGTNYKSKSSSSQRHWSDQSLSRSSRGPAVASMSDRRSENFSCSRGRNWCFANNTPTAGA